MTNPFTRGLLASWVVAGVLVATPITYSSPDVPKPIPDNSSTTSTLSIPDNYLITTLTVQINVTHTFDSDLVISLVSPGSAVTVQLANSVDGSGDNFTDTIFDDAAGTSISAGTPPFTGSFRPEQPLSGFNGLNINGTWTLQVADTATLDTGTLNSWSITADSAAAIPEPSTYALAGMALAGLAFWKRFSTR